MSFIYVYFLLNFYCLVFYSITPDDSYILKILILFTTIGYYMNMNMNGVYYLIVYAKLL